MMSLDLQQAADAGIAQCGAKAFRLGVACMRGSTVLPGRVLVPDYLSSRLGIPTGFAALLAAPAPCDAPGRRQLRLSLREQSDGVRWLRDPAAEMTGLLTDLGHASGAQPPPGGNPGALIVRSSALVEDGARYSWAGIFDSVFCAADPEALAAAVRQVWASQWSHSAYLYARRIQHQPSGAAMAVLIQPARNALVGGVAFSQDPVEPASGRRLVEATWGLPKAVVDGAAEADRYTFTPDVADLQVHIGRKSMTLALTTDGVVERASDAARRDVQCLTRDQLRELDQLIASLETAFDGPQDVEWAYFDNALTLLQTRPQTAGWSATHDQDRTREDRP